MPVSVFYRVFFLVTQQWTLISGPTPGQWEVICLSSCHVVRVCVESLHHLCCEILIESSRAHRKLNGTDRIMDPMCLFPQLARFNRQILLESAGLIRGHSSMMFCPLHIPNRMNTKLRTMRDTPISEGFFRSACQLHTSVPKDMSFR